MGNRSILFDLPAFRGRRVLLISAAAGAADGLDVMLPYPHEDITLCVNLAVTSQERGLSRPPTRGGMLY